MRVRDVALSALCRFEAGGGGQLDEADLVALSDERDRALAVHLVQGVIRWRSQLDWVIAAYVRFPFNKIDPRVLNILRLAVYQIMRMERVPPSAAVNEAVGQAKRSGPRHVAGFVNGLLRRFCREARETEFPDRREDPVRHLALRHAYPEWLVARWLAELGIDATEALLAAGNRLPTWVVRTNRLKVTRADLMARLGTEGVEAAPATFSPDSIILGGLRGGVTRLRSFQEGLFQVQGEGAQLFSLLLAPAPGEIVLDLCAGLGGKTTHMAELMGDRGRIVAVDLSLQRLRGLVASARRLGISCIQRVVADAAGPLPIPAGRLFDRIMVDAPCSGLGVISKRPDIKWNRRPEDIGRLASLQLKILTRAAGLLKEGGRLFYGTCTLTPEENEGVVAAFLEAERAMGLEDLRQSAATWAQGLIDSNGFLKILPHVHGLDGFFGALMRRGATSRS